MKGPTSAPRCFHAVLQVFVISTMIASPALAGWPDNPSQTLRIADLTGDQVQPKIRAASDGGCYISWFDNYAGGYDVFLQLLDRDGAEAWEHNGIRIADRSYDWTMDYDLAADSQGNAVVVFNDDRSGVTQITAVKVARDGTRLWGPNGVQVSKATESDYLGPPYVAVTMEGNAVIAWAQNSSTIIQKLDPAGQPQWGLDSVVETPATGYYMPSDIVAADAGSFIVSFVKAGSYSDPMRIYTEKYSSTGQRLWGPGPVAVMTQNSLQYGNFPPILPDGNGGAFYSWYDVPNNAFQVHVQHLNASGTALFPVNGALGATTASRLRVSPSIAYDRVHDRTFMFWTETDLDQGVFGLFGQKFDAAGTRQWTDAGKTFVPMGSAQVSFISALAYADGAMVFYFDRSGPAYVRGFRVNAGGAFVWSGSPIPVCTSLTDKGGLDAVSTESGMALLAWADGATGNQDVLAQNVNPDGTLGLPIFFFGDLNCDGTVDGSDISGFVLAMIDPTGYSSTYPNCRSNHADGDGDGALTQADVALFVQLLLEG